MNKKLIVSGIVVSTLLGGTINSVYADNIQNNEKFQCINFRQQGALQDIDNTLKEIVDSINKNSEPMMQIGLANNGTVKYSGINIKETNTTNVLPLFLGSNTFHNETDREQTYNTSTFSQAITNTTSTSVQNGFKTGLKVSGSAGIPFVAEGKVEASLEYNFSHTGTKTKSKTDTITAPAQSVKVPTGKIYKAEVYFEKKSTSGKVDLFADVNQGVMGYGLHPDYAKLSHFLHKAENKYGAIQSPNDKDSIRIKGSGIFKIEYGTNLIVKTYDITSKPGSESTKLVNTKIIPLKTSN